MQLASVANEVMAVGAGGGGWAPPPGGPPPGGYGQPPGGAPPGGYGPPPGSPPGQPQHAGPSLYGAHAFPGQPGFGSPYPPEDIEPGKAMAILSHVSSFLGFPLWIIPLIQKDNAFALYHAKQALAIFLAGVVIGVPASVVILVITWVTCGVGALLYLGFLAFWYPTIVGLINAMNGKYEPVPWFGFIADKYFSGMVADKRPVAQQRYP